MKRRGSSTRPSKHWPSSGNITPAGNGPLFTAPDSPGRAEGYPNGDRDCQAMKDRITRASCVIQSYRNPDKCAGCKFKEAQ